MENAFTALRSVNRGFEEEVLPDVNFGQTIKASLAYKYAPILNRFNENKNFSEQPQDGFDAEKRINEGPRELMQYSSTLLRATNDQHYDYLLSTIEQSKKVRRTLASSGIIAQFGAELFDPTNYIGLPFARIGSFGARALKGGASVTAVVAAQEAVRYPNDPLATKTEVALNLGASFAMGGALTGLLTIPANRTLSVQKSATKEFINFRKSTEKKPVKLDADGQAIAADGSIASSVFTDSWLFKGVTTPMKRVLQSKVIPNSVKMTTLKLVNDSGILLAMNRNNQKVGSSVFQNSKQFEGEWAVLQNELMPLWGKSTGKGVTGAFDYTKNISGFEKWLENIDKKSIRGEKAADDIEAQAMDKMNVYYKNWETRLSEQNLIGSAPTLKKFISGREIRIAKTQRILSNGRAKSAEYIAKLEGNIKRYSDELDEAKLNLEDISDTTRVNAPNEINFRPRYFDIDAIKADRAGFERKLVDWFRENPMVARRTAGKVNRTVMNTDEVSLKQRASDATDNILGIKDITDPEIGYYGMGKSKHFKHRSLDIPNKLILDYIQTNPIAIMRAYTSRVGPRYEFSRQFNGASIDDVLDDAMDEMMSSGMTMAKSYAALKDIRHLYKRVVGGVLRDPDSWDQTYAKILRDLATLNFLGSAGIMTLTEPAKIMMEHGIGKTMKALTNVLEDNKLKLAGRELRISGEGLDNLMNAVHTRMVDELNNNPFKNDILDKMKNPFFLLNGLGPITKLLKDFDAMVRSDTLIDYSVRWTQGKATKMEQEYLLRYNIDLELATNIANAPWQKSSDGMYMANTGAWTDTIQFPATKAEVVSGNTKSFAADGTPEGRYRPAFYNAKQDKIYIDEEYIKDVMWELRGWENPRVEGVTPIKEGIINSPDDYVAFIKMHEIMHSLNRPEDLGILIQPSKKTSKAKPKISISSKISNLKKRATSLFDEANALEKPSVNSKEFNQALEEANILRLNTIKNLNKNVDEIRKASKESQDFYESMQSGFKPDDKQLKNMLEKERKLTSTATNLKQELADIDASIKNLMTSTETASAIKGIEDSISPTSQKADQLSTERVKIEGEIQTREFLKESKIDYDDLSNGLKNKASDLAEEDYSINNRMDDDGDSFLAEASRQEKVFNEELSKFKKDAKAELKVLSKQKTKESKPVDKLTKEQNAAYENAINDLTVKEIEGQPRTSAETVREFRSALSSGVLNTILMGTPADKPSIVDGIVYIPMRVAKQFGMKEDVEFKGYARIENGLLGLPFQFYSYSLASVNKVAAAHAHGQLKDRFLGTAISMGLGYMVLQYKTPDWVEMSFQDKLARSFDYSGTAALYSDMVYTAMSTSLALGGPNLTGGLLEPRFPQEPNVFDAITGIAGAGTSIQSEIISGVTDILTGNIGSGVAELVDSAPFTGLWFAKSTFNEFENMLKENITPDGVTGFKRY